MQGREINRSGFPVARCVQKTDGFLLVPCAWNLRNLEQESAERQAEQNGARIIIGGYRRDRGRGKVEGERLIVRRAEIGRSESPKCRGQDSLGP